MSTPLTTAAGITLPLAFSRDTPASLPEIHIYAAACIKFLSSGPVSALLECHPNDIAIHGPGLKWQAWWQWASTGREKWKTLVPGWGSNSPDPGPGVPEELEMMLETADQLTLPRTLNDRLTPEGDAPLRGMSPKKAHEVLQMSAFIQFMLSQTEIDIRHVVDVGAGQGYLSRSLSSFPLSMDVLALDFSEVQTRGAERRGNNIHKTFQKKLAKSALKEGVDSPASSMPETADTRIPAPDSDIPSLTTGSLTHQVTTIIPQTLSGSVSRWISDKLAPSLDTPVLFVALHACGTLTPDIFRCFLANQKKTHPSPSRLQASWYASALVVVGCCYNLMSPDSDFPLSELVSKELKIQENRLHLSYNHRSLAAQSPLQWALNHSTKTATELAIRKVVYRALFGKVAISPSPLDHHMKVGRLRDSAYSSFEGFILEASKRTGVQVPLPLDKEGLAELTSCLEVLHVLRSRIGPVVESLIIVDRYLYLAENAHNSDVYAFNLFEQELGSSRNYALAVFPHKAHSNL